MKRSLIVLCVAVLLATLPLAHVAAAPKANKVEICHVTYVLDSGNGYGLAFGRVIEVSASAVAAHEAHGDSVDWWLISEEDRYVFEEIFNINLRNANAWFPVFP